MSLSIIIIIIIIIIFLTLSMANSTSTSSSSSSSCNEVCGAHHLPYPFHILPSCGPPIPSFRLSCLGNRSLYLPFSPDPLRILSFLPSSTLLLDYSSSSSSSTPCARWYSDGSRLFDSPSPFFAVAPANSLRLYDCEDSSICRAPCTTTTTDDVDHNCTDGTTTYNNNRGCCYPLSDGTVWKVGDGFGVFREFGCRGFSSWVLREGQAQRGIEMEWALPRGFVNWTNCAEEAVAVNATAVRGGFRCACGPGFIGDGFAAGTGCFKCRLN